MPKKSYKRKFNLRLISEYDSYYIVEIVALLGVSESAVRYWLKQGLKIMDDNSPTMIYGEDLKEFLGNRQKKTGRKCKDGEMYCGSCKTPKKALNDKAELIALKEKTFHLKAKCITCNKTITRIFSMTKWDETENIFTIS